MGIDYAAPVIVKISFLDPAVIVPPSDCAFLQLALQICKFSNAEQQTVEGQAHHEIWEYFQSTRNACDKMAQSLMVMRCSLGGGETEHHEILEILQKNWRSAHGDAE